MVYLQFQGRHCRIEVYTVEVLHEQNLTVTLPSVTRLRALRRFADLAHDHIPLEAPSGAGKVRDEPHLRDDVTFELVQARVNLPVVELLRPLPDGLEHERFRIPRRRIDAEDVQHNVGCGSFVATTNDIAITDDENQLPFIVVVQCGQRVDGTAQRVLTLGIARDLAKYEFVQTFGETLCPKLQRSQNYSATSGSKALLCPALPLTF